MNEDSSAAVLDATGADIRQHYPVPMNENRGAIGRQVDEEWCMPQRTGTRRYVSTLQSLFWQYEQTVESIDRAARCAKRRYENAKAICARDEAKSGTVRDANIDERSQKEAVESKETSKETRAQLRLVRHYALQRSLLHAMCLSLVYTWRTVLYSVRAVSDAPVPTPTLSTSVSLHDRSNASRNYAETCYRTLHETFRDCSVVTMQNLIDKCQTWIGIIDSTPSVRSLHEVTRPEVLQFIETEIVDKLCRCRAVIADCWIKLLDYCDRSRIERNRSAQGSAQDVDNDVALLALQKLTGAPNGGTSVALHSRNTQPAGRLIDVSLPALNTTCLSHAKPLPFEVEENRLLDALRAIGGSGNRQTSCGQRDTH